MEKDIQIDGKAVLFKASGNTPRMYRVMFQRDIFKDISKLRTAISKAVGENGASFLEIESLEVFENVAYVMYRQGNPEAKESIETWLDGFETFSIYEILPEIIELWNLNNEQISESKKNIETLTAK